MNSGKPRREVGTMHVFVACQIDVVNEQFVSPLSWNNLLSETLGQLYMLMNCRHLFAEEKHSLDVYNM